MLMKMGSRLYLNEVNLHRDADLNGEGALDWRIRGRSRISCLQIYSADHNMPKVLIWEWIHHIPQDRPNFFEVKTNRKFNDMSKLSGADIFKTSQDRTASNRERRRDKTGAMSWATDSVLLWRSWKTKKELEWIEPGGDSEIPDLFFETCAGWIHQIRLTGEIASKDGSGSGWSGRWLILKFPFYSIWSWHGLKIRFERMQELNGERIVKQLPLFWSGWEERNEALLCENLCEKTFPKLAKKWKFGKNVELLNTIISISYVILGG